MQEFASVNELRPDNQPLAPWAEMQSAYKHG